MKHLSRSRSSLRAATVIASVLAIAGATLLTVALRAQQSAPKPPASAAGALIETTSSTRPPTEARASSTTTQPELPAWPPTLVTIPSIGVTSALTSLGRNADGSVEVPTDFQVAGWYNGSVTPGQAGPTIVLGHVDSTAGPGIFFRLGALRPGALVTLHRMDGKNVTYKITGVRQYPKDHFPTLEVYANTSIPTIRLITCGGAFDNATHHYLSNIVAFGQVV
jgi:sortase (surface protein transpeptidase)